MAVGLTNKANRSPANAPYRWMALAGTLNNASTTSTANKMTAIQIGKITGNHPGIPSNGTIGKYSSRNTIDALSNADAPAEWYAASALCLMAENPAETAAKNTVQASNKRLPYSAPKSSISMYSTSGKIKQSSAVFTDRCMMPTWTNNEVNGVCNRWPLNIA